MSGSFDPSARLRLASAAKILVTLTCCALGADATAQPTSGIAQVEQSPVQRSRAVESQQVPSTSSRTGVRVGQLPAGLSERAGPAESGFATRPDPAEAPPALTMLRPSKGSVDADAIARLLARGEAQSIDAASAIAADLIDPLPVGEKAREPSRAEPLE